ncbi:hypothetical protein [Sorangium sp. So ce406]|uniref:hypothetical protein n=1 Tax=Sorangium sp. So ce406 TaxID=3133311 RepID=UPI003F5B73AE
MSIEARRQVHRRAQGDGRERDPTHYPVEKKMGEDSLQTWIVELLRPLIERWYREAALERIAVLEAQIASAAEAGGKGSGAA